MPTIEEQLAIQAIVAAKNIPYLVHFTRVENLPFILQHGLQPRSVIDQASNNPQNILFGINAFVNDGIRVDYKREYNCLSISFPNHRMFWGCRQNDNSNWVVLLLHPRILWEKDCLFYPINAASGSVNCLPIENFNNSLALENMFIGERNENMPLHDPTDVQAEVMVQGPIEPHYIMGCIFNSLVLKHNYSMQYTNFRMFYHPAFFSSREYARNKLNFIR